MISLFKVTPYLQIFNNGMFKQGLKYRFLRIYRYFNFTEISEKYRWIFFHKYRWSENYLKLIGMLEKTSKNDKISKNTNFKVIL